tara:strand:+ start:1148 stop:1345 length:198 start_codon:yes stop_codon:yes gene_type:complete
MNKPELEEKLEELVFLNESLIDCNASLSHQFRVLQDNYVKLCMRVNVSNLPKSNPSFYKKKELAL